VFKVLGKALAVPLLLLWAGSGAAGTPAGGETAGWRRDALALEAELRLASTDKIYIALDARDATVRIKAAGLTLKLLPVTRWSAWGSPAAPALRKLVQKGTLIEPKRPTIKPEAAPQSAGADSSASAAASLDVLELGDMPVRFGLELEPELHIAVQPEPEGFFSRWWERLCYAGWYLTRPFPTLWHYWRGRPYTALYLRIAAQDARALYWACRDGVDFLVIAP